MKKTPEISIEAFEALQDKKASYFLLDVREPDEYESVNMGGYLIPLQELPARIQELDPKQLIVVHCKSGGRSNEAGLFLLANGFSNVLNLKGGIMAWLDKA